MARSLADVVAYLKEKKVDDADELETDIAALIDTEKATGVKASKKKNKENETLRTANKALEPFKKFAVEKLGFDEDDDDLDDFGDALAEKLGEEEEDEPGVTPGKKVKKAKGKATPEFTEMQKQLKTLTKNMATEQKARKEAEDKTVALQEKNKRRIMSDALVKGLKNDDGKPKLFGADLVVRSLIDDKKVGLKEDGETVVFLKGAGDDAEEVAFDEGIKQVIADRKDLVVNDQQAGTGSSGGGTSVPPDQQSDADRLKKIRSSQTATILS